MDPPADALLALQDDGRMAGTFQFVPGYQPCHAGAHHDDFFGLSVTEFGADPPADHSEIILHRMSGFHQYLLGSTGL